MRKAQVQIVSVLLLTGITIAVVSSTLWWGMPLLEKGSSSSEITDSIVMMKDIKSAIDEVSSSGGSKDVLLNLKGDMKIDGANLIRDSDGNLGVSLSDNMSNSIIYEVYTKTAASALNVWVPIDDFSPIEQELYIGNETTDIEIEGESVANCELNDLCLSGDTVDINCTGEIKYLQNDVKKNTVIGNGYRVEYISCKSNPYVLVTGKERPVVGYAGQNSAGVVVMKTEDYGDRYKTTFRLIYRELDDLNNQDGKGYLTQITKKGNNVFSASKESPKNVKILLTALDRFVADTQKYHAEKTGGPLIVTPVTASFS